VRRTKASVRHTKALMRYDGALLERSGASVRHSGASVRHSGASVRHPCDILVVGADMDSPRPHIIHVPIHIPAITCRARSLIRGQPSITPIIGGGFGPHIIHVPIHIPAKIFDNRRWILPSYHSCPYPHPCNNLSSSVSDPPAGALICGLICTNRDSTNDTGKAAIPRR